jgi:hypothetical protein
MIENPLAKAARRNAEQGLQGKIEVAEKELQTIVKDSKQTQILEGVTMDEYLTLKREHEQINSTVLNAVMDIWSRRQNQFVFEHSIAGCTTYCNNTFFMQATFSRGPEAIRRWKKQIDFGAFDKIIFPCYTGNGANGHFFLIAMLCESKLLVILDSLTTCVPFVQSLNTELPLEAAQYKKYLDSCEKFFKLRVQSRPRTFKDKDFDVCLMQSPFQGNTNHCGVAMVANAVQCSSDEFCEQNFKSVHDRGNKRYEISWSWEGSDLSLVRSYMRYLLCREGKRYFQLHLFDSKVRKFDSEEPEVLDDHPAPSKKRRIHEGV